MTSSGNVCAGADLFQLVIVSIQSRTNCLSNDGGEIPVAYESAGQKRDESAVNTSSIKCNTPLSSRPNSNLVSAMMIPRVAAYSEASVYNLMLISRILAASSAQMRCSMSAKLMFSSCSHISAFAAGVKRGSGNLAACGKSAGKVMPQMAPVA